MTAKFVDSTEDLSKNTDFCRTAAHFGGAIEVTKKEAIG